MSHNSKNNFTPAVTVIIIFGIISMGSVKRVMKTSV
jgi:hypothetical protein